MIARYAAWAGIALGLLLTTVSGAWLIAEKMWSRWEPLSPRDAFIHGTIGLETFPLKYAAVMQDLSHASFFPEGEDGNLWADYGFVLPDNMPEKTCASNVADWAPLISEQSEVWHQPDRVHLTPEGSWGFARLMGDTVAMRCPLS